VLVAAVLKCPDPEGPAARQHDDQRRTAAGKRYTATTGSGRTAQRSWPPS